RSKRRGPLDRVLARAVLDSDPAELGELFEGGLASEAAPAAVLDATEGHRRLVVDGRVVDVAHTGLQLAGNRKCGIDVAAEDGGRESVFGVVCDPDRLVDTVDGHDRDDRSERFL